MSHYTLIQTEIREVPILLCALAEMGFSQVEHHEEPQHLYGYQDDRREETAEVIIRREFVGSASNDVGFKRRESGAFEAIVSEYDRQNRCDQSWLQELNHRYSYNLIQDQVREQDLVVEEEQVLDNGDIVLVLSERG